VNNTSPIGTILDTPIGQVKVTGHATDAWGREVDQVEYLGPCQRSPAKPNQKAKIGPSKPARPKKRYSAPSRYQRNTRTERVPSESASQSHSIFWAAAFFLLLGIVVVAACDMKSRQLPQNLNLPHYNNTKR